MYVCMYIHAVLMSIKTSTFLYVHLSYSTIVRDHKGVGVAHEKASPKKPASSFPDNYEAVLVR